MADASDDKPQSTPPVDSSESASAAVGSLSLDASPSTPPAAPKNTRHNLKPIYIFKTLETLSPAPPQDLNEEEEEGANPSSTMGRVRTKTVKKSSRQVIERYYSRMTLDFHTNKKVLEEVAIIPSKRLRNKIAGFTTHLMRRIQKGPVRGISLKLQEEERERRMDFVPDESALKVNEILVDKETLEMLAVLGMADLPGVEKHKEEQQTQQFSGRVPYGGGGGRRGGN
ncbi:40S ribosomal protein S17 [Rhynchospora pubera]|uniref:40S ribosomal protein S17 n=2 Tax=Rhynchospora pubera TaxID=906938 RepID=A0AAV8ECV9_9POAL|nr:40S ribosomal protein S17 [Rhynchospora pubera]KAJ4777451.1 40S ribosomal protein S17 [Rhynchospora pubera]